jgi:hypothetical protein
VASMINRRRLAYGLVVVLAAFAVLSFVLPYVGGGDSGLTKLIP